VVDPIVQSGSHASIWYAGAALVLLAAGLIVFDRSRRRRLRPEERTFRSLARRMRLKHRQIQAVRRYAKSSGRCQPLAVLMNQSMLREALG
jgi:hypothetical protein